MTWDVRQGDALELLRTLPDESVDALITDPPYSSGGFTRSDRIADPTEKYVSHGTEIVRASFTGDNRDQRSWCYWMALWLSEACRVVKTGGYAMVFSDWRQLPIATDSFQAGGFVWRGLITWDKTEGARAPHTGYFRHQGEYVVWGTKGPCLTQGRSGPWPGVFRAPVIQADKHHMTGKPTALMVELARAVRGGVVLDPFCGSGSTGVGALRVGCSFIGFEREPHYVEVARRRLADVEIRPTLPLSVDESSSAPLFGEGEVAP